MENLELGTAATGVVGVTVMCSWRWEDGWTVGLAYRRSGSDQWGHRKLEGVPEEHVPGMVQDMLADALGVI